MQEQFAVRLFSSLRVMNYPYSVGSDKMVNTSGRRDFQVKTNSASLVENGLKIEGGYHHFVGYIR